MDSTSVAQAPGRRRDKGSGSGAGAGTAVGWAIPGMGSGLWPDV